MTLNRKYVFVVALLTVLYTSVGFLSTSSAHEQEHISIVEPLGDLYLRSDPPHGWFYRLGEKLDVVKKGEKLKVLDKKTVNTLFGEYEWVKIERQGRNEPKVGWVYSGKKGEPPYLKQLPSEDSYTNATKEEP